MRLSTFSSFCFALALVTAMIPFGAAIKAPNPTRASSASSRTTKLLNTRGQLSSTTKVGVDFDASTYNIPQSTDGGQKNMAKGWAYMSIYWICGFAIAKYMNYFSPSHLTFPISRPIIFWYSMAALTTLVCKKVMSSRNITYGRESNIPATAIFAMLNGVWETMWFYGSYDIGKWLGAQLGCSHNTSLVLAFSTFLCYSGAIHILFWLQVGLPPHVDPKAPNFLVHGFPALAAMSIAWMAVYEVTGSIVLPVVLHILLNYFAGLTMHLPGPSHRHVPGS